MYTSVHTHQKQDQIHCRVIKYTARYGGFCLVDGVENKWDDINKLKRMHEISTQTLQNVDVMYCTC